MADETTVLLNENRHLRRETRLLRQRIEAFEGSRWWRLHPRFLVQRRPLTHAADAEVTPFEPSSFAAIRESSIRSASIVAPAVHEIVSASSVVDVGGGEGWWGAEFARLGARTVSIDEGAATELAPGVEHVSHDLRRGLPEGIGRFDLALCLEVAEHLEPRAGERLVAALRSLSSVVLFSAAIPGQGGQGHLNEQWPGYWVDRFEQCGFSCSAALRWRFWSDDRVASWYRQNLLFCTADVRRFPALFETPLADPLPVVHPVTFARAINTS